MTALETLKADGVSRRVFLLETDERGGLVAAIAEACHIRNVSLEITTGLSHVLLTFRSDDASTQEAVSALAEVPGVAGVHPYTVMTENTKS